MSAAELAFFIFTAISFAWDLTTRKLPNWLCFSGWMAGVVIHAFIEGGPGLVFSLGGACSGFALALPLRAVKAVGAGDVKWFAAAGAFQGAEVTAYLLIGSIILSGAAALIACVFSGSIRNRFITVGMNIYFRTGQRVFAGNGKAGYPFMASVLPAAVGIYFWR